MSIETKKAILLEKNQVFEQPFKVQLKESCSLQNGILKLTPERVSQYEKLFTNKKEQISFFIPASGSGSRMFAFLYQWLEDGKETKEVKQFFENIESFPFFSHLKVKKSDKRAIAEQTIDYFAHLPKGLIPFHSYKEGIRTAFQEHVFQIQTFFGDLAKIHFTIQKNFENAIKKNLGVDENISFSYQNEETNAYCFSKNGEVVVEDEDFLRRPAGHGALLENLNNMDSDIVILKNIDNVQHFSESKAFHRTSKQLLGVLFDFKSEMKKLLLDFSVERLKSINENFPFLHPNAVESFKREDLKQVLNRPTRICGVVKNQGEPGGGPFWIEDENGWNNQIIEKAQIDFTDKKQSEIVQKSSHFNPVFIVLSKSNIEGKKLDLMNYRDDSKFFVVEKTHKGKKILYRELPGLWNGSMSNWNTIFVEIPLAVFTPVKSLLDLL